METFKYPIIVKPVDSSGSKGVSRIDCAEQAGGLLEYAMSYSRGHRIIVEEFVEKYGYQIAGDGLSVDANWYSATLRMTTLDSRCKKSVCSGSSEFPLQYGRMMYRIRFMQPFSDCWTLLGMRTSTYNFVMRIDRITTFI